MSSINMVESQLLHEQVDMFIVCIFHHEEIQALFIFHQFTFTACGCTSAFSI